jgi:two-component system, LuxR family, response regulator FixJ
MPQQDPLSAATVHVVDDDDAVRESLVFLLETAGHAVRSHASATECLAQAPRTDVGCVITDVRMPEIDGLELQQRLAAAGCGLPVIVITGHSDVPMAVRALKAGAVDFLEKPFDDNQLLSAVGQAVDACRKAAGASAAARAAGEKLGRLTAREREVLDAMVAGHASKEIARALGVSPRTVEVHRARVMEKMGARSVQELVHMVHALDTAARPAGAPAPC